MNIKLNTQGNQYEVRLVGGKCGNAKIRNQKPMLTWLGPHQNALRVFFLRYVV